MAQQDISRPAGVEQDSTGGKTILLVEDDGFHRELMERSLSSLKEDYRIITAANFRTAQQILDEAKPHLIVSDLRLPDGSALDFLAPDCGGNDVPVIVITSQGNEALAVQAMKAGAMDYVVKSEQTFQELSMVVVRTMREWEIGRQRNQALKDLYQSEERFRAVFESSTDHMALKNSQLEYTQVNPAMAEFFGREGPQFAGLTDRQLFGSEVAEATREWDARALAGYEVEEQQEREVNGHRYVFLDTRVPLRDSTGNTVGLAVISREITRRLGAMKRSDVSEGMNKSKAMRAAMEEIGLVAGSNSTLLFLGESGSGKDYLARWCHKHSPRSAGPFYSVDCATISEQLAESELFGHERGAFTGAIARKKGLVELAEGGTLLLNEIGELPMTLQSKLLTFLDTMTFMRVGGEKQHSVNVRLLAATHRDLQEEVNERRFLTPLYYRLNVISVRVPSLRERKDDLPELVNYLMGDIGARLNLTSLPAVSDADIKTALAYDWPGNVRELKNIIERSLIMWDGGPFRLLVPVDTASTVERTRAGTQRGIQSRTQPPTNAQQYPPGSFGVDTNQTLKEAMTNVKRCMVEQALNKAGGSRAEAARLLGVSRDAVYRFIREYNIRDRG